MFLHYIIPKISHLVGKKWLVLKEGRGGDQDVFVRLRPSHPTPGIELGDRMRCAISSISSVSATLDTRPR